MMYKKSHTCLLILFVYLAPCIAFGQDEGIKFEHNLTWQAILTKARAENKYIFVDCFATWCAPCKYMTQKIFTRRDVGGYFNEHFINVAVQMDRTSRDSDSVKQWYAEASEMSSKFAINDYPTYLFFSPNGEPLDRIVGSFEAKDLIEKAKEAFEPEKQYYVLVSGYMDHLGDSAYLRNALNKAIWALDRVNTTKIGKAYVDCLKNPFERTNIDLVLRIFPQSSDDIFQFLMNNSSKIDAVIGKFAEEKIVENELSGILAKEKIDPLFYKKDTILRYHEISDQLLASYPTLSAELPKFVEGHFREGIKRVINSMVYSKDSHLVNWQSIGNKLKIQYSGYDCAEIIAEKKPEYYAKMKMWTKCERTASALLNEYGFRLGPRMINNIAWDYLFLHSSNRKALKIALKWSKRTVELEPNDYNNLDTYANLLYKIGDRESAAVKEREAVKKCELFNDMRSLKEIQENLHKIQMGEKTWM